MMKKLLSISFVLFATLLYAQIPSYYNDVNLNLTGTALKDELSTKIINTQATVLSYTPGVWNALQQSDLDPTDPSKVLLIYGYNDNDGDFMTDRSRGVNDNGGGIGLWNREHVYPRSLGIPNLGTTGPGSDAHSLRPSDGQMNSSRSNRKFAAGNGNSGITPQGNFYPGDEWKGDVARMMMYMYLRYGNQCLPSNVAVGNVVAGDANMIDVLLQWNADDPVNFFEDNRNSVIAGIQGNRNPFVDNPALATQIWGGPQAEDRFGMGVTDTEAPSEPANLVASNTTSNSTVLSWSASTDNVGVTAYDVFQDGGVIATVTGTTYNVSGLAASTTYSFSVNARDAAGNTSANSSSAITTTGAVGTGGNASELFISEYIEGSSNNKALEVANFTGATVDLSGYSLRKATNGSGSFTSTFNLTGQLANGEVYVVANSSATAAILNEADATSGVTTFNGNDAIGLFKDNVLIDKMGNENSSANFAKDVTLRRKSSVLDPNTTYTVAEWDQFPQNTFDDLGTHTVDGGTGPAPDTEAPSVPTNVVASNVTTDSATLSWSASTDNVGVTGYDVYQGDSLLTSVTTTGYTVTGLAPSTNYVFTIRAKDAAGNVSNASSNVGVTTATPADTQAPSVPTNVVAFNITTDSATLSWSASTDNVGVTGYDVYQGASLLASVTTTGYTVTGLAPSTNYVFSVRAKDAAGNVSNASSNVGVTTASPADTQAPSVPTNVVASNVTTNSATLSWSASTDNVGVTGYDVYQGNSLLTSVTTTGYTVTGLAPSTNYVFSVRAKDAAGNVSNASSNVGVTTATPADTQAPSVPTNVVASNVTTNSATLSWSASTDNVGVTGYDVYQGASLLASVTTTGYTVTGLAPSTNYVFSVRAKDAAGNVSNASSNVGVTTATPADTQAPSVPTNVVASNVTTNSATLSWSASTDNVGVTGYDVYQGASLLASVTTTGYAVTGLAPSTNYVFSVRAKDAAGNVSNASSNVSVTTDAVVLNYCNSQGNNTNYEFIDFVALGGISNTTGSNGGYGDFTNLTANINYGSNTIVLSAGFPGQSYTEQWRAWIDFNQNGTFESSEQIVAGSSSNGGNLSYNFTVPTSAVAGPTRLRVSMEWNSAPTACETFTYGEVEDYTVNIGGTSGARLVPLAGIQIDGELGEEESVFNSKTYENFNTLHLEMKDNRDVSYIIYNMSGRFVAKGTFRGKVQLNNLDSGMYIININDGQRTIQKKIIKK